MDGAKAGSVKRGRGEGEREGWGKESRGREGEEGGRLKDWIPR